MKTNKIIYLTILMSLVLFCIGCSDNKQQEIDKLNKQLDSLLQDNQNKDANVKEIMSYVGALADGLDSIAQHENMLLFTNKGKEGTIVDRQQLKKNLEMFEKTLADQKQRIAQMADSLKARGEKVEKLTVLVNYLNKQLEEKDNLIKSLKADLNKKNINITQLQGKVNALNESNTILSEKVETHEKALALQTEMINEGYVLIGTKKELSEMGVISGGLFKKKKINFDALQKSQFKKVDIRKFTELRIDAKKPQVLSQMPVSSYRLERNGSTSTLYVSDPTAFWSVSNYLIIVTK